MLMKKYFNLIIISGFIILNFCFQTAYAQSIKFVPYPAGNIVTYNPENISRYVTYNNNLYFTCATIGGADSLGQMVSLPQLGYSDGNTTTLIPNIGPN